jgi:hypothetical protein
MKILIKRWRLLICISVISGFLVACGGGGGGSTNPNVTPTDDKAVWDTSAWDQANWQ